MRSHIRTTLLPTRTRPRSPAGLAVAALVWLGACGTARPPAIATPPTSADRAVVAVVEEARAFMAGYARDLLAGDRAAIVARYDPTGAYLVGDGRKAFASYDSIRAQYAPGRWSAPASFEWQNLSYEGIGPDAVVVVGQFRWGGRRGAPLVLSYSALLRRGAGGLHLRVEDESAP